jgi:hypothetical protein
MSVFWVDIIEDIVDKVRADTTKPASLNANQPYYLFGHPLSIESQLQARDEAKVLTYGKYPVIVFFMDFKESYGDNAMVKSEAVLHIAIVVNSEDDITESARYDLNFRNTLYPLYELFIKKLVSSQYFLEIDTDLVPHDKYDRPFWGRNNKEVFTDHIDAIEISNLELKLSKNTNIC